MSYLFIYITIYLCIYQGRIKSGRFGSASVGTKVGNKVGNKVGLGTESAGSGRIKTGRIGIGRSLQVRPNRPPYLFVTIEIERSSWAQEAASIGLGEVVGEEI